MSNVLRRFVLLTVVVGALALFPTAGAAAPILWTLTNFTPLDGTGTVTGAFRFDADTNLYSNLFITTTAPNETFNTSNIGGPVTAGANGFALVGNAGASDLSNQPVLMLFFQSPLTNAGGTINMSSAFNGLCYDAGCSLVQIKDDRGESIGGYFSGSVVGTAVTVPVPAPEPATLLLLGTGLVGAGVRRWRHRPA